ncbi:MAG TPA: phosphatidylglycerophosphatase A [Alphaproteobacteria bacterium]|nr:phosphatidylglycerophosphatase A [Alphaproteobacteria bacterium]
MTSARPALPLWHPATLIATWFGAGLLPKAPGTWGSLAALPFAWLIMDWGGSSALLLAALFVFGLGWLATRHYLKSSELHDPPEVVVDEVSGQWLTLLVANPLVWWHWPLGFALFRLFDIVKVWPASELNRREDALGVMADDTAAAFYAVVALALAIFAFQFLRGGHGS